MKKSEIIELIDEDKSGTQVFLDIRIKKCYGYTISFSSIRRDTREFNNIGINTISVKPISTNKFKIDQAESSTRLTRAPSYGDIKYFDIGLSLIECINMDKDPYLVFHINKSPNIRDRPYLKITASRVDENGNSITYKPYDGEISRRIRIKVL